MAVVAVGLVGAAAFSAAGIAWFGMTAAATGWMVGTLVGGYLFRPEIPDVYNEGPRLEDLKVTSSSFGVMRPYGYGTYAVPGNIIDASTKYEKKIEDNQDVGGKGGGGGTVTNVTYEYSIDLAVGLGEGPIDDILQIYANEILIYDVTSDGVTQSDSLILEIYKGTEDQEVDPTLYTLHGDHTPAYRGEAYVVFTRFQLAEFGNQVPSFRFVVSKNITSVNSISSLALSNSSDSGANITKCQNGLLLINFEGTNSDGSPVGCAFDPFTQSIKYYIYPTDNQNNLREILLCSLQDSEIPNEYGVSLYNLGNYWYFILINITNGEIIDSYTLPEFQLYNKATSLYSDDCIIIGCTTDAIQRIYKSSITETLFTTFDAPLGYEFTNYIISSFRRESSGGKAVVYGLNSTLSIQSLFFIEDNINFTYSEIQLPSDIVTVNDLVYDSTRDYIWAVCLTDKHIPENSIILLAFDYNGNNVYEIDLYLDHNISYGLISNTNTSAYDYLSDTIIIKRLNQFDNIDNNDLLIHINTNKVDDFNSGYFIAHDSFFHKETNSVFYVIYGSPTITRVKLFQKTGNQESLSNIVDDICKKSGYDIDQYDSTDLDTINVNGYAVGTIATGKGIFEPLMSAFLFDIIDDGDKLIFQLQGNGSEYTINEDELGAYSDSFKFKREIVTKSKNELPSIVSVTYINPDKYYESNTQQSIRLSSSRKIITTVPLAISLTDDEAARISEKILHIINYESETYAIILPPNRLPIKGGDIVTFTSDGVQYKFRVTSKFYENGVIRLIGARFEASLRISTKTGASVSPGTALIDLTAPSFVFPLDLPALRTNDMDAGIYIAATSYFENWYGGELFSSQDNSDYASISTLPISTVGIVSNVPENNIIGRWDTETVLSVTLSTGELESVTEIQALNNLNVAAWGKEGRYEIICFQNAELVGTNKYNISKIIRARRCTEWAMDHQNGDNFILLTGSLRRIAYGVENVGLTYKYLGVSYGLSVTSQYNIPSTHQSRGESLIPFSPTHLVNVYSASGLLYSWQYRSRAFSQSLWNPSDLDDGEWEVDIVQNDIVIRTITSTASANGSVINNVNQTVLYTNADQTADSIDATFEIYIYQVSTLVGRGHPSIETVNRTI